ncbi:biosynthetic-type acetolactate synthase large subunit [Candidatus Poribacteria bacterium]|nr:MAG: biosynthetic-type acetolactate synthase large subunit [Candidatus Poribacteria bacterium]
MKMRGAKILLESLKREGVEVMFGIPGGAIIHVFDDLYDDPDIRFIHVRHEQAAAHAADGYARATGKVGVAIATSGPGATNLVTGIATAYMDSIPIVTITGQVPTYLMGNDAFQEVDFIGITRPICKHSYLIRSASEVAQIVKQAFYIAKTGRPGPVIIDFPKDAQTDEAVFEYPERVEIRGYKPTYEGHPKQIAKAAELINNAKRPVILAGGGVIASEAWEELRRFAIKTGIPVTTTLMGLGSFPETHPLSLKMLGMHGTRYANYAVSNCDLLICIGARFDDRVTGKVDKFAPEAKIIHIDIDPSSIGKTVAADVPIVGDAKRILRELIKLVKPLDIQPWIKQIEEWKRKYPLTYKQSSDRVKPQFVIEQIYEATRGEAVIVTDVGQHQMWAAQFYQHTKPRHFLSSGGLGTMGYGFPAAIGAQVGCPDKLIFVISGDGSFQMNMQELSTVVMYNLPVKVAIINNSYLGMVRQWQELFFNRRYSAVYFKFNPDFAKLAQTFGIKGIRVERPEQVRPAIDEAIDTNGPVVIDFIVDSEENVFPMVPAGAPLEEMIGGMA